MILFASGAVQAQFLSAEFSGLGTTETETRIVDGIEIAYPADQGDLVDLLEGDLKEYRETRRENAGADAARMMETLGGLEGKFRPKIASLLSLESASSDFDTAFEAAMANLSEIAQQWQEWSGDVSAVQLWNSATRRELVNQETGTTAFADIEYRELSDGQFSVNFQMPFLRDVGAGVDRIRPVEGEISPHRLDIPILAAPGVSAEESAKDPRRILELLGGLHQKDIAQNLTADVGFHYLYEALLRHEIESRVLDPEKNPSCLVDGLSRFYLIVARFERYQDEATTWLVRCLSFDVPKDPKVAEALLDRVAKVDPTGDTAADPEFREAAGRIFAAALLEAVEKSDSGNFPGTALEKAGLEPPQGGWGRAEFLKALRSVYPDFDRHLSEARADLVAKMRELHGIREGKSPASEFELPRNYEERQFGGFTFTYPRELEEAVERLAPEWVERLAPAQEEFRDRFDGKRARPLEMDPGDLDRIRRYGLDVREEEAEMWAIQTAALNNSSHFLLRFLGTKEVDIWIEEDLVGWLESGVDVPNFRLDADGDDAVQFNVTFPMGELESLSIDDYLQRIESVETPGLPVVVEGMNLEESSVEERVAAMRQGDSLIDTFIESVESDAGNDPWGTSDWLSEEQSYFFILHELAENSLLRSVIASGDRRWFCDGLANFVAMRACDEKFGAGSGLRIFESIFPPEKCERLAGKVDLLAWKAPEVGGTHVGKVEGLEAAHYYFAGLAILEVAERRGGDEFIAEWIERIRETRWVRTNAETAIRAYGEVTGDGDLRKILAESSSPPHEGNVPER